MTTKTELQAENLRLTADNTVLLQALNLMAQDGFQSIGHKCGYAVKLGDPCGAHGGIVMVTFAPGGQQPFTQAHYLERWYRAIMDSIPGNCPEAAALRSLANKAISAARVEQANQQ